MVKPKGVTQISPSGWQEIVLGPFSGGINTSSDASAIGNTEMVDCINLEVELDGSLTTRPPIQPVSSPPASSSRIRSLGGVTINGISAILVANDTTVWTFNGTTFTQITTGLFISAVCQYKEKAYLVASSGSALPGGSWDGTTFVAIATLPRGNACLIWQERMWVVSGDFTGKLSFSNIADPGTWTSTDFFNIAPGNGERLRDLVIYNNNLILFKEDSTYLLSYSTKPADAVVTQISASIGVSGQHCVTQRQNYIYVYHEGDIYQMVNYQFVQINIKVPFFYDASAPSTRTDTVFMCMIGTRLLVRYFNYIYVYGTLPQSWTRWASADSGLHNFGYMVPWPTNQAQDVVPRYFGGSCLAASGAFFKIQDGFTSVDVESPLINCSVITKDYDVGISWKFKRLFFWGADVLTNRPVTGITTPIVFNYAISWGDIKTIPWSSLLTWDQPTTKSLSVTTNISAGAGTLKRFLKFNKGLRFRQAHFEVDLQTDGSITDGPTKLYTMTLFLSPKETVTKSVS